MGRVQAVTVSLILVGCLLASAAAAAAADTAGASAASGDDAAAPPKLTRYGHKLLWPLSPNDIGLFIVVAIALFIAAGAGVGGGVLVVPALLMVGQFSSVDGVGLSNITVLSLAVATMSFQITRRSPARDGPLIDWDLVLLFGPPSVVGSISGSYINMIIPSWVTKVTLLLLLLPITWRMLQKAHSLYKKENAQRKLAPALAAPCPETDAAPRHEPHNPLKRLSETLSNLGRNSAVIADDLGYVDAAPGAGASAGAGGKGDPALPVTNVHAHAAAGAAGGCAPLPRSWWRLAPAGAGGGGAVAAEALEARILAEERAQLPPLQVGMLVLIMLSVVVTNITGGYLVHCGTWRYWLVVLSPLPLMLVVWAAARQHVLWKRACKRALGLRHAGDIKWDGRNTALYPLICISSGLIAGLLGLGGGLILTPLLLELGVHPAVSVASSQITMLIGNSTSAIVYAVAGAIPWDYGATLIIIGFLSALSGQVIVSWVARRLGRSSLIVMVLCVLFTLAACASLVVVVTTMVDIGRHPEKLTAHKTVCIK